MDNRTNSEHKNNSSTARLKPAARRAKVLGLYGTMTAKEMAQVLGVTSRTIENDIAWMRKNDRIARRGLIAEDLMKLEAEAQRNRLRTQVAMAWEDLTQARNALDEIRRKILGLKLRSEELEERGLAGPDVIQEILDEYDLVSKAYDIAVNKEEDLQQRVLRLQYEHRAVELALTRFYVLTGAYNVLEIEDKDASRPMVMFHGMDSPIPEVELQSPDGISSENNPEPDEIPEKDKKIANRIAQTEKSENKSQKSNINGGNSVGRRKKSRK